MVMNFNSPNSEMGALMFASWVCNGTTSFHDVKCDLSPTALSKPHSY